MTYISWSSDYLQDYLMDERHSWCNGSVWHIDWPYQVYVCQWPIFYGSAILLHILKSIWWRNVVLGIMDQCYSKIDLVKYICGSVTYISWSIYFAFCHCHTRKLFLYIMKWCWPGVFVPLRAIALVLKGSVKRTYGRPIICMYTPPHDLPGGSI